MNKRPLVQDNEPKLNADKLCLSLSASANKVVSFLTSKLQKDGSYGNVLVAYFFRLL